MYGVRGIHAHHRERTPTVNLLPLEPFLHRFLPRGEHKTCGVLRPSSDFRHGGCERRVQVPPSQARERKRGIQSAGVTYRTVRLLARATPCDRGVTPRFERRALPKWVKRPQDLFMSRRQSIPALRRRISRLYHPTPP